MIYLFFFLKFKSQLRRTRSDIVRRIDEILARLIVDAGGKITGDRSVISAVFNEDTIGFWLDMYILIENLKKNIESSSEFFGYSLIICSKIPNSPDLLCRFLANRSSVFLDEVTVKKLLPYACFDKPFEWLKGTKRRKYGCGSYYRISKLKDFKPNDRNKPDVYKNFIENLKIDKDTNILLLGQSNLLLREGIYQYCNQLNDDFPVLKICFESEGIGAIVDIWSPGIRSLCSDQLTLTFVRQASSNKFTSLEEIDSIWEFLFKERIRDEVSEYVGRCVRKFILLVIEHYLNAVNKKNKTPVLLLENIHLADNNTVNLLINVLKEIISDNNKKLLILGTAENTLTQDTQKKLETIFSKTVKIDDIKLNISIPRLSVELWEIIYSISLFNRFFSPELFHRLFEEEEKNPIMLSRALSILHTLNIIDSIREPRLTNRQFEEYACKILEDNTDRVKTIVCNRLISWTVRRNISPCFRLLLIINSLNGVKQIDDILLLKVLTSDIVNKTVSAIEISMENGQFDELLKEKAAVIRHIYKTSRALNAGYDKGIDKVFSDINAPVFGSDFNCFPVLNAQILVNFCGFYLGRHEEKKATEKAKEAISLGQSRNSFCLPQAYRLFSLVCLSKQKINESIEYLGFALTNAEKIGNNHETAISAYYAAVVQFLYGDIYNSLHLARKSIEQSLAAGHPDWADRSRFLEGRLEFELGNYLKACDVFENLLKEPYGCMTEEKNGLLLAWIYRSRIYFGDSNINKPEDSNYDADLFEIEAAYLSGDYKKVLELSVSYVNPFTNENFLYTEKADWFSGFAQCEHLYFTHGEIQSRMICLFKSLALSCLLNQGDPAVTGEDPVQCIQQILRDEKLCEIDPWDSFYFYAKYRILEQAGSSIVDLSTAVSMAFKRLQRRAGRIEEIETRRKYLNGSRWNRELSLAAKEFKLI